MRIQDLSVSYGERVIYDHFTHDFPDNEITAILGPSGCGKTTLLNSIAYRDNDFRTSYVFQEPRLLPWCTIEKNIMLVLEGDAKYRKNRAREYLSRVGLENRAGEYPDRLSGGERQRVAIARAFSAPVGVLLMDEPFQSQDPALKAQLIELVKELQRTEKRTILAVTHDVREATALADRAVVLGGRPVSIMLDIAVSPDFEKQLLEVLVCQTSSW
jgi:ABC-type nitrate/sulfonate/bicarbonate transport system ATPase subunit